MLAPLQIAPWIAGDKVGLVRSVSEISSGILT